MPTADPPTRTQPTADPPARLSSHAGQGRERACGRPSGERRLEVLRAIVEDFIATNEPVGSKALVDRHRLGVSSATIRNDMAALEEEGLIVAPHTSAGRVPTDLGYRVFVDRLADLKPMSGAERRAIAAFLEEATDLDDVVHRAVRTLAQLTRSVAVMQYPTLSSSRVRHVEVVSLAPGRGSCSCSSPTPAGSSSGSSTLPATSAERVVADLRTTLNAALRDRLLVEAPAIVTALPAAVDPDLRDTVTVLTGVLLDALVERRSDRVVLAGTANLSDYTLDFPAIRPGARGAGGADGDAQAAGECADVRQRGGQHRRGEPARGPVDRLGHRHRVRRAAGAAFGAVGVLGPRRMDYGSTMGRVAAVARYVGQIIAEN